MNMKYFVLEIQKYNDGNVGTLIDNYDDTGAAFNKFYTICAAAAISTVSVHTAIIFTEDGVTIESKTFRHEVEA